nr:hypothetical protein Iba_chr13cCG10870 [Ipomoea batatas]
MTAELKKQRRIIKMKLTSLMWPETIRGYIARTTRVSLQFKIKAMMKEVTTRPRFCKRILERSTTTVRSRVASLSKREANIELVLSITSNHPISFFSIAAHTTNTLVNMYAWRLLMKAIAPESFVACAISSGVASCFPYRMFSLMVVAKRAVLFPDPLPPTRATIFPGGISRHSFSKINTSGLDGDTYRPAMTTLSMVVKESPPLAMFLWTTMLVNHTSKDQERKRTQCKVPSPSPLASPAFFPYLYVFTNASVYDFTAFSSPVNACTVLTLPTT